MSLFKVQEFWSTTSEDDEYFDQNSLIVTKLNSDSDFIITGSQSGVLRIFKPSCDINDNNLSGFHANDLIVEKIFDNPILQIGSGKFVLASPILQVSVLHPMLLSVYNLITKEGITEHGTQNILELVYEHRLRRSSANFTIGPFGGTQNRDFICVQSLDGMLTFFEQETETFRCLLPEFLLPSPVSYVKKTDSFVSCSSNWCIVSYRYKALPESSEGKEETIYSTPKLTSDWSYNLGESVTDIIVIDDSVNRETWISVLGERNLFSLNEGGRVRFTKRLEYSPVCFTCYVLENKLFSLVVSETNTLLIYQNTTLKWSANLYFLPVCIRRCFLENVKGAIVFLSEEGRLGCNYLGTEPCLFVAPPLTAKEIDFDKAEQELIQLNRTIKNAYGSDIKVENASAELLINIKILEELETCTIEDNIKEAFNNQMCTVLIELVPHAQFQEVQVSLFVQKPLKIVPSTKFYSNLKEKATLICHAFLDYEMEVPSLVIKAVLSLTNTLGVPRTLTTYGMLPLNLVMEVCTPLMEQAEQKITINMNRTPPLLATIFPELVNEDIFTHSSSSVVFKNVTGTGHPVAILPAKSSERFRLQSDYLSSIALLAEQLIYRLKKYFQAQADEGFKVYFGSGQLPASGMCQSVRKHFEVRGTVSRLQNELSQLSSQFRIIQKRLIAKLNAKNPSRLTNIELIMEDTYSLINDVTDELENELDKLFRTQAELACCLNLIWNLIQLMDIDNNLKKNIESLFCVNVQDLETQSWEDVMDGSLCYLLRTKLAKSEKDRLRTSHTSFEEIKDVGKVEKHLTQVLERLVKVGPSSNQPEDEISKTNEIHGDDNKEKEEVILKPIGSQIAESSSRLLSTRKSLLRRRRKIEETEDK